MASVKREFRIQDETTVRLDLFLAERFPEASRTRIQEVILAGSVLVNGKIVKAHYKIRPGDWITAEIEEKEMLENRPEDIPLKILYEDQDLLAVDKPAGMVVHPACGNLEHTLVNALLYHTRNELSSLGGGVRPGIVHRLDKDTSGVMVVAKNDFAHRHLAKQFKKHSVVKTYEAIVKGVVQHDEMKCEEPVGRSFLNRKKVVVKPSGGKEACTYFRVIERFSNATHVEAKPVTGRTHQVRVHLAHLGYPILGDSFYGGESRLILRHALHAKMLEVDHPKQRQRMRWVSELAPDMTQLIVALRG